MESKTVLNARSSAYTRKATKELFWIFICFTITEIMFMLLLMMGFFQDYLLYQNNLSTTKENAIFSTIVLLVLTWVSYISYRIVSKKAGFRGNKIAFAAFLIVTTTIQAFGHWKIPYLSILYCIPVVMTSPLGKKTQTTSLFISLFLSVFYYFFQIVICYSKYNLLNFSVTVFIIVTLYFVTRIIYKAMANDIDELTKYSVLSKNLTEQLSKDLHTGALSKKTFMKDVENDDKNLSIAFLDIDDFKEINETYGISVGDNILENLVECSEEKGLKIYRYDGDEFTILSRKTSMELGESLEDLKFSFSLTCNTYWSCKPSFSAGVVPLRTHGDKIKDLYRCEEAMQEVKHNGKNAINVLLD